MIAAEVRIPVRLFDRVRAGSRFVVPSVLTDGDRFFGELASMDNPYSPEFACGPFSNPDVAQRNLEHRLAYINGHVVQLTPC